MALQPDVIVLVKCFCTVYFWYEDKGDGCCVIVIHDFEIVGHQDVPDKLNGKRPTGRLKVPGKKFTQQSVMKESGGFAGQGQQKYVAWEACVRSIQCLSVSECVPPDQISLPLVACECVFVTKDVSEMKNHHERFLCYYYYATTIYQKHGKGNRITLYLLVLFKRYERNIERFTLITVTMVVKRMKTNN
jgi:hypothetical protein